VLDGLDGQRDFDRAALAKVLAWKLRGLWPEENGDPWEKIREVLSHRRR
jgi:hypothetical protein